MVVEADGNYVEPFAVDDIDIYSVLLTTDKDPSSNYWIRVGVRGRTPKTSPALALLNYRPTCVFKLTAIASPVIPALNDTTHSKAFMYQIHALAGMPPATSDRRIELLNTQNKMDGHIKWSINMSLVLPARLYLGSLKLGLKTALSAAWPSDALGRAYDVKRPP